MSIDIQLLVYNHNYKHQFTINNNHRIVTNILKFNRKGLYDKKPGKSKQMKKEIKYRRKARKIKEKLGKSL